MIQFRLGPIPVEVHFSHLLMSAVFSFLFIGAFAEPSRWPSTALADPSTRAITQAICVASWMVVISLSVLVHELGHALASRAFGYAPTITLVALGGLTNPNAQGAIPWHKDVMLTLAGPFAGLGLGLACLAGAFALEPYDLPYYVLRGAFFANAFWAVVNLLPVSPLDGGRVSSAVLMRLFGRRGFLFAQVIALLVGALVVVLAIKLEALFLTVFFGLYAYRAVALIQAYMRGEAPAAEAPHPFVLTLQRAGALAEQGRLDEAMALAAPLLENELAPTVRSQVHHLLGWISLKQAKGREALDHFAQVQGKAVEPHALAAAFSLIGDEERALALWELAYRESKNRTILHEWAGALIRAGKEREATQLPQVDMAAAYSCAERVLFLREDFLGAAQVGEKSLVVTPSAELAYDTACAYARAGQPDAAMRLLHRAAELGFTDAAYAATDSDLGALQGRPEFGRWLSGLPKSARA